MGSTTTSVATGAGRTIASEVLPKAAALLVGFLFAYLVSGFLSGWYEGLRFVIMFASLSVGLFTIQALSLDARLARQGTLVHAMITETRVEIPSSCCRSCDDERYSIQYTYTVNGAKYENKIAWYPYHSISEEEESIEQGIEIFYLADCPKMSLPKTRAPACKVDACISPSAGSLNHHSLFLNWNYSVFLVLTVGFDVAFLLAFKRSIHDEVLLFLAAHIAGVPLACLCYFYAWLKPLETKQEFLVPSEVASVSSTVDMA